MSDKFLKAAFLRLPQVLALVPISKSSWWKGCRTGIYPKPVKLGPRTTAWRAEDIENLIAILGNQDNTNNETR